MDTTPDTAVLLWQIVNVLLFAGLLWFMVRIIRRISRRP